MFQYEKGITMRALIILAALGLAACQPQASDPNYNVNTSTPVNDTAVAPADDCGLASDTLVDEKALIAAETAYNLPAHAYVTFDATGNITPELKAKVRPLLIKSYDALKLARVAYNAGDGCSLKRYSDLAQAFGSQAKALLPK
jgi:hypothetical protein